MTAPRALVTRTVDWVWMESGEAVREAVMRARMQERQKRAIDEPSSFDD
jgi:hypothetical protein